MLSTMLRQPRACPRRSPNSQHGVMPLPSARDTQAALHVALCPLLQVWLTIALLMGEGTYMLVKALVQSELESSD